MASQSEKTPLVPDNQRSSNSGQNVNLDGGNHSNSVANPAKTRLRKFHSAPIKSLLSTGMDVDTLRLSYASKLVLAAVEGRSVESAVDLLVPRGDFINPLAYPIYRPVLVCVILAHMALALMEGGKTPFPLHPLAAASEVLAFCLYTADISLNLWTFGVKQYRDKKWQFVFTVVWACHFLLLAFGACAARWKHGDDDCGDRGTTEKGMVDCIWWNAPRLALLGAHALRPMMLISKLQTIRRVFTNVLRTASRTGSILTLGMVVLTFYSVLGINLFNSEQVKGYAKDDDNFDNFAGAVLALFVLTTEENFPMVADPSFTQRPAVAFPFFISFLLIFLVVILPLLLGIVLDAYAQQHSHQHAQYRHKAQTALLAAYYVLDEDGALGLSQDQLVGVLTAEAGVDIDTKEAERLWEILVPDEDEDTYIRSSSVPVKDDGRRGSSDILPLGTASAVGRRRQHPAERGSNTTNSRAAAFGAHYRRKNGVGGIAAGRLDIHGFLKLVDLLHEKVVAEDGEIEDGNSSSRRLSAGGCCSLAGYDNDVWEESATGDASRRMLERREDSVRVNFLWDLKDESGGQSGSGLDEYDTDTDGGSGESATRGSDDRGDHGRGKITTLALKVLKAARGFSINVVGRAWFLRVSQVVTVCLTALVLVWTPRSQDWYDRCMGQEDVPDRRTCQKENMLRQAEGLALLVFLAEMVLKGLAVGFRRLWRLHWAHRFDFIVLWAYLATYVVIGIPGNRAALYVDSHPGVSDVFQLPRAMIVLRLVTVFPQLRRLLETMVSVAGMLLRIMVLYSCVSYAYAAIGMAIFGDARSDILEPRYSFATLPEAFLALFFLTVTNNWNDLLYPLINSVPFGRWSALFLVTYMLFCATMMLDVLVGVVIEGFRVSKRGPQHETGGAAQPAGGDLDGAQSVSSNVEEGSNASFSDDSSPPSARRGGSSRPSVSRAGSFRRANQRKYKQVRAEDMFRPDPKGELSAEDARELEEAVRAVEERLHQAWVNRVGKSMIVEDAV